jgi:hypothetical protein
MFKFSQSSVDKLNTVNPQLKLLAEEVLKISPVDFVITEGIRTKEKQLELYNQGKSKTLQSKHLSRKDRGIKLTNTSINDLKADNSIEDLGEAIDICPVINGKLDYMAESDLFFLVGLFYAKAIELKTRYDESNDEYGLNIKIRVGALWDGNSIKGNRFVDGWHIEINN